MSRTIKIFGTGEEQARIAEKYPVIERYDGFVLAEVSQKNLNQIARAYPVEDITERYTLQIGERIIDTALPRFDARGKRHVHPAYKGVKTPAPGRHHNLVQFIGPIKEQWLRAVKKVGGEARAPYGDFTYIIRADEETLAQIAALPFVRWTGHLPTKDRVAPSVFMNVGRKPDDTASALPRTRVMPEKNAKGKVLIVDAPSRGAALTKKLPRWRRFMACVRSASAVSSAPAIT